VPKNYTANYKDTTGSTTGEEPVYLLEITHPQLATPIRIVNDTQDLVHNGSTFFAVAFRIQFPDDIAKTVPQVPIAIDNVGREMTQFLEQSGGGKGAQVRIMQVMRDTPDLVEQEYTLTLIGVRQTMIEISGQLSYENFLDIPALGAIFTPETAPGLF